MLAAMPKCGALRLRRPLFPLGALLALFVLASGCSSSRVATGPTADAPRPAPDTVYANTRSPSATASALPGGLRTDSVERDLRRSVATWEGVPHLMGGTSREGVDCSALIAALYDDVFALDLPRSTEDQMYIGDRLRLRDPDPRLLQPGDLVFFLPEGKRHVGLYLGDAEFVHASSSQGVMVSRVDEDYWQEHYWMTRRVLPTFASTPTLVVRQDEPRPESSRRPTRSTTVKRPGW